MTKFIIGFVTFVDTLNLWIGKCARWLLLPVIFILLYEALVRYAFNSPTNWSVELSSFMFGAYFILGGAYTLLRDEHVRMDALYGKFSVKKRAIFDIITFTLLAIYMIVFIIGGANSSLYSLKHNHHSASMWGPPLAPIKIITTIGGFLVLLQGISNLIKNVTTLFKRGQN
jgi:TRAP-type mannitol/chloroaromatic compound transport system permease small subunit